MLGEKTKKRPEILHHRIAMGEELPPDCVKNIP